MIRVIPKAISKRLSDISCNKSMFDKTVHVYEKALKIVVSMKRYHILRKMNHLNNRNNKKKRKHNKIWFNPPYSVNVKTNIGKIFFKII